MEPTRPAPPITPAAPELPTITDGEWEVLALVAEGLSNSESRSTCTSGPEPRRPTSPTCTKLDARDERQLVIIAHRTAAPRVVSLASQD
jgi:hypothetical protein